MPESVQSCIELSIHLSVKRTSRELPTKNSSREKNTGKCMESSKHDWMLSGTATSLQISASLGMPPVIRHSKEGLLFSFYSK